MEKKKIADIFRLRKLKKKQKENNSKRRQTHTNEFQQAYGPAHARPTNGNTAEQIQTCLLMKLKIYFCNSA